MNESSKSSLGVLAFVALIGVAALIAYKIKDVDLSKASATVDKVSALLNVGSETPGKKIDVVTIAVGLLLLVTIVQVIRLKHP